MIERRVQLTLPHRVFFTDGVFDAGNETLVRALTGTGESESRRRKVLVVIEEAVAHSQPGLLEAIPAWFAGTGKAWLLAREPLVIPGGESCKNDWPLVEKLWAVINEAGIDRHSYVIAIGGGAVLDLVGFASATAHRGIRHVRMPTTTLSQGDGGVGVKNGVNFFNKKNWVGSFAVPWAVVNDHRFLTSLPDDDKRDGIIEAIKVSLIRDAAFYGELEAGAAALGALDDALLRRIIRRSAELHVEHICTGGDPFELGSARPLDFGHWVAHKIEPMSNFAISHGKAVATGMAVDLLYAKLAGLLGAPDCDRILTLIENAGFHLWHRELTAREPDGKLSVLRGLEDFREHLGGELTITLVTAPGKAMEVHEMDGALVEAAISELEVRSGAARETAGCAGK
ncbi:MAG TPA: 3-dehydroquinate synthase [Verrucomicrobiales bacterium]|nr:3-dehydroquinate synthase [Verrucomicrobiales bacterium]